MLLVESAEFFGQQNAQEQDVCEFMLFSCVLLPQPS
jgi:hypothetical protein